MAESWNTRTVRDMLRAVFSRWLTALLIVLVVVGAAVAATFLLPKVYEAEARLQTPMSPAEQTLSGDIRTDSTWEVRLKLQHDLLTGDTVLSRVLAIYNDPTLRRSAIEQRYKWLDEPARAAADYPDKALMEMLRRVDSGDKAAADATGKIDAAAADVVNKHQDDLIQFRKDVRMEVQGGQQTAKSLSFSIFVRADDARKAKLLADLLTEEFSYRYHELLLAQLKSRWLPAKADCEKMRSDKDGAYGKAKAEFAASVNPYKSTAEFLMVASMLNKGPNTDVGTGKNQTESVDKYIALDSQAKGLGVLHDKLAEVVKAFADDITNGDGGQINAFPFIPPEITNQPAIAAVCQALTAKFGERAELMSKYRDDRDGHYQGLVDVKTQIRQLETDLLALFRAELTGLEARKAQLDAELAPYKDFLGDKPAEKSGKIDHLGTTLANFGETYSSWSAQQQLLADQDAHASRAERDYEQAKQSAQITITDRAIQPEKPIRPIVWLNLLIGAVVGVLLALSYVFLADYYDHSVRGTDDVERYLGVPVLASVGRIGRRSVEGQ